MPSVRDLIYFALTVFTFGGIIAGVVFVVNKISEFTSTTKEKLRSQGYNISDKGVHVQTQKHFNREAYVDATQRGLVKAWGASSFGKANGNGSGATSGKLQTPEHTVRKSNSGILRRK